jgi:hypothetical protein
MWWSDPQCMLYALQWLHMGHPPDIRLVPVKDPAKWAGFVTVYLLGALNLAKPHLFEPLRAEGMVRLRNQVRRRG